MANNSNKGAPLISVFALIISIVCFIVLSFITSHVRVEPQKPDGSPVHSLDAISLQIDILSLILAVAAIILAVIGFFGFQAIKEIAVERAEKIASETAREVATQIRDQTSNSGLPIANAASQPSVGEGVVIEKETEA